MHESGDDVAWVLSARPPAPDDPNGYWLCEHLSKDPASADSGFFRHASPCRPNRCPGRAAMAYSRR